MRHERRKGEHRGEALRHALRTTEKQRIQHCPFGVAFALQKTVQGGPLNRVECKDPTPFSFPLTCRQASGLGESGGGHSLEDAGSFSSSIVSPKNLEEFLPCSAREFHDVVALPPIEEVEQCSARSS